MARGKSGMCYTSLGKLKIQDSTIYSHKDNNQKDFECKKIVVKKNISKSIPLLIMIVLPTRPHYFYPIVATI